MAKDATQTLNAQAVSPDAASAQPQTAAGTVAPPDSAGQQHQQQIRRAVVAPSTVINIAVHSLLMVTVPFALFFTALLGGLDPFFTYSGHAAPSREVKSYLGAGLAVLGVNLVSDGGMIRLQNTFGAPYRIELQPALLLVLERRQLPEIQVSGYR
eukprot:gene12410-12545_t